MKTLIPSGRSSSLLPHLLATLLAGALSSAWAASPSLWNGGGTDDNWSTPANWNSNVPVPGTAYDLQFGGLQRLTPYNDFSAGSNFRHLTFNADAGAFTLGGNAFTLNGHITNNSPKLQTINLPFSTGVGRFVATAAGNITLGGAISGNGGLNLVGPGAVTLTGKNSFTNYVYVNGGILNLPAGGAINNKFNDIVGQLAGSSGALNISGGTLTNTQTSGSYNFCVGHYGYGAVNMTAGTVQVNSVYIGYSTCGTLLISGGNFYCGKGSDYVCVGIAASGNEGTGVLTLSGGLFSHAGANRAISLNNNGNGRGELNLLGGTLDNTGGAISYGYNSAITSLGTGTGIVNLNGGTLLLSRILNYAQNPVFPGFSYLNFNGGTLTATANTLTSPDMSVNSNLVPVLTAAYVNGPFGTFAGGAVIDSAGQASTINAALLAPTGQGVRSFPVTDGGAGYTSAPYVSIFGDGTGATAIANMADDGTGTGTLKVDSITVCNPGVDYTSANVSFIGSTPTRQAMVGAAVLAPNTCGGLTKNGAGSLTLTGPNTYTGLTTVNAGLLVLSSAHRGGGTVLVQDGAAFGVARDAGVTALVTPSLTLGTSQGAELDFLLPDGAPAAQVLTVGTLTLNGLGAVRVSGANFVAGDHFPVLKYTTLIGDPAALANGTFIPPAGCQAKLVYNPGNSSFDVEITAVSKLLTWAGTVNSGGVGAWDNQLTANWRDAQGSSKPFLAGADVVLDDTAAGVTAISLSGDIEPASVLVNNSARNYLLGGPGALSGPMSLTKTGTGTLTISNANTYTGATLVNGGTLAITSALTNSLVNVTMNGGSLKVNGGLQISGDLVAGTVTDGAGAVNVTGGALLSTETTGAANLQIGAVGYGAFNQSGGIVSTHTAYFGSGAGTCVAAVSGGTLMAGTPGTPGTTADYILVGASTGIGTLTVSGGLLNHANVNRTLSVNNSGDARGELNLLGGVLDNTGGAVSYGYNAGSGAGAGIVSLNGGNLLLNRFVAKKQSSGDTNTTGLALLNFNGGTLTATTNNLFSPNVSFSSSLIPANMLVRLNGPFGAFAGGAVLDTAGQDCQVVPGLLAPTGQGVRTLALVDGGAGYLGAPYVSIQGDGTGATAVANMIDDGTGKGTLKVGSLTVCNPGVDYTSASFTLIGGGASVPATPGNLTLAANTSGGLIKNGAGTLSLLGANTYTGPTRVNGGALRVNGSLHPSSTVTVAGGALGGSGVITGPVTVQAGGTLAPGGVLTLNNTLDLAANSTTFMNVNASSNTCDLVQGLTTVNYGGTLIVSNTAGALTPGQTFSLFSTAGHNGNFASLQSAGGAATWNFDPASGVLTVVSVVATPPTNISYAISGNALSLTWPASHLGWFAQSNSVSVANPQAWYDIPGSQLGTNLNLQVNPAMGNVFYRLRKP
jgi:fibronectin-binding autotransporter adhesin